MSLSTKILIGLLLGIATGLFLGELAEPLAPIGIGFIRLLQMSVLPYVAVSLIAGLGELTLRDAGRLASRTGLVLLAIWGMTMSVVLLMPLGFPDWEKSSFFSASALEQPEPVSFIELYVPNNPFASMADGIVPAVVVFSVMLGIALMSVPGKSGLVRGLRALSTALTRISGMVVQLAPIGVFAISASAAGTMSVDQLGELEAYMVIYLAGWALLTFVLLPLLVTTFTPLGYREVFTHTKDALITAFATGSVFVVLTVLSQRIQELLQRAGLDEKEARTSVDVIVPTSFSFPSAGTLLALGFIEFAAWAADSPLTLIQQLKFALVGPASFFSSPMLAMPFLLDLFRLPADLFQQFVITDVLTSRFGMMLAAMHTVVIGLLGALLLAGKATIRWRSVARYAGFAVTLPIVVVLGARGIVALTMDHEYRNYERFVEMGLQDEPAESSVTTDLPPLGESSEGPADLEGIVDRGVLRVAYFKDSLPFAFVNEFNVLVGFDVEMAHHLAKDLGLRIEFVRIPVDELTARLDAGDVDVAMTGIGMTAALMRQITFTTPYLDQTLGFVVLDHRRSEFSNVESIVRRDDLTIAVPSDPYFLDGMRRHMPGAKVVPVESPREFFTQADEEIDALIFSAEAGSAWCLVYPQYSVVVPEGSETKVPLGYAVSRKNPSLAQFLDTWVELAKRSGRVDGLYGHWILGEGAVDSTPRWSVIRDVLGWID